MQEKNTNVPSEKEKKPGEGTQWPETGKQGDIGKKGGSTGGDLGRTGTGEVGKTGDVGKKGQ